LEKARTSYDIRHHFVGILIYELPFGKGGRWMNHGGITNHVLSGWEFTGTQTSSPASRSR
jgi:hypothetical protein